MIISIFTPHGGCPERCHFCDQKTSGGTPISPRGIQKIIDEHLSLKLNSKNNEVAFYGGTFTAMRKQLQLQMLDAVFPYLENDTVSSIRISTRPDCIEKSWIEMLSLKYKVKTIELGVQSFNPKVLKNLGRTHHQIQVEESVELLKDLGLKVSLHVLIGSPGEKAPEAEDREMLSHLLRLKPNMVRIHPLLVLEGTTLEQHYKQNLFKTISIDEAVERAAFLTQALENTGIKVIRLGLQENELLANRVVAGPHDPGFGGRVRGLILRKRIESRILEKFHDIDLTGQVLSILLGNQDLGRVSGPGRENLKWLQTRFGFSKILLQTGNNPSEVEVRISNTHRSPERRQVEHF